MTIKKTSTNKLSLTSKVFISTIFIMTLMCLTNTLTSLFDGVIISKYIGDSGTATKSLCNAVDKLIIGLAQLIGLGTQVVVTRHISKGKRETANKVFNMMFLICVIISFMFTIIGLSCSKYIVIALSAGKSLTPELLTNSTYYLFGYFIGVPFMFLGQLLTPLVILDGDKKLANFSLIFVIIINCLSTFLFGRFSSLKMFGIGFASTISSFASFTILLIHFIKKNSSFKIGFAKPCGNDVKDVLINGSPMGLKYICVTLKLYLFNIIILSVGNIYMPGAAEVVLTARGAQETISGLFETCCGGILLTVIMMSSVFYNEEDSYELKKLFKNILKFTFGFCYVVAIVYFFTCRYIATAYLPKGSPSLELCIYGMRCGAITILFLPFNSLFLGFLQGTRNVKFAYITTFLQSLFLPVGCMAAFGFGFGAKGLFIGYMLSTMLYMPIYFLIVTIKNKRFPNTISSLFGLRSGFGNSDNQEIRFNYQDYLSNKSYVLKEINKFLNENKIKNKRKLILKYCDLYIAMFKENQNNRKIVNFRIVSKNKKLTISCRNNLIKNDFINNKNKSNYEKKLISFTKTNNYLLKYSYVLKTNNYVLTSN